MVEKSNDEATFKFTWKGVRVKGASEKVFQKEMIAHIKSGIVEAPIDCNKGWCSAPEGDGPEFTINVGQDGKGFYSPVGICEVGWRKQTGDGESRGSYIFRKTAQATKRESSKRAVACFIRCSRVATTGQGRCQT